MERMQTLLDKATLDTLEYDLNVFYEDTGEYSLEDGEPIYPDVLTVQPSIYYVVKDTWESSRIYMESFKLTLEETRAIAPDFPMDEWGDDFFIGLEHFIETCKALPDSLKAKLDELPDLNTIELDPDSNDEVKWIN
jgi:hypothetical protein